MLHGSGCFSLSLSMCVCVFFINLYVHQEIEKLVVGVVNQTPIFSSFLDFLTWLG
jgi:hypothetical protein